MISNTDKPQHIASLKADKLQRIKSLKEVMIGKTIKSIDETFLNCLTIEFTDGSELMLEVEAAGHGLYTNVGYIKKD